MRSADRSWPDRVDTAALPPLSELYGIVFLQGDFKARPGGRGRVGRRCSEVAISKAELVKAGGSDVPAGRDRGKRRRIVEAATAVFLEVGFGDASMDRIAQVAGVSKVTIYNHFGSKDVLFAAIITDLCDRLLEPLTGLRMEGGSPERVLTDMARRVLEMCRDDAIISLYRIVVAESPRFPELGAMFYRLGPARAVANLAGWLADQDRAGILRIEDAEAAAEQFLGMARAHFDLRRLLGIAAPDEDAVAEAHVHSVVASFLRAHATPAGAAAASP
ncbi:MAG: TetR/AcrR family transcriptional regulator [Rhodospirillales bacterium]|nr:MAG: TetR/AcrR family transcriptional regulator [Rhodospirillales bacterium]